MRDPLLLNISTIPFLEKKPKALKALPLYSREMFTQNLYANVKTRIMKTPNQKRNIAV
jgi:hypothetical protein